VKRRANTARFRPRSLDAVNFLLADVRGALGPYLNVFLVTQVSGFISGALDEEQARHDFPTLPPDRRWTRSGRFHPAALCLAHGPSWTVR
jgi:hypothetical protein